MKDITMTFTAREWELMKFALITADVDANAERVKYGAGRDSVWGRECDERGRIWLKIYDRLEELKQEREREEWEKFRAERRARGERWVADC